jgi:regulator of replication initiation timing
MATAKQPSEAITRIIGTVHTRVKMLEEVRARVRAAETDANRLRKANDDLRYRLSRMRQAMKSYVNTSELQRIERGEA